MNEEVSEAKTLPVWRTVRAAYLVIFHNPGLAAKLGALPFAIAFGVALMNGFMFGGKTASEVTLESGGMDVGFFITVYATSTIYYLSTIPMITAWHRLVLLGHGDANARVHYTVGHTERAYLWKAILYGLILLALLICIGFVGGILMISMGHVSGLIVLALAFAFPCALALRLSLVFPSAAIGEAMKFTESWKKSRKNTWRLFCAVCLGFVPFLVIPSFITVVIFDFSPLDANVAVFPTLLEQALISLFSLPFTLGGICVGVSVWSWSYRYLVQDEPIVLPGD